MKNGSEFHNSVKKISQIGLGGEGNYRRWEAKALTRELLAHS